MDNFSIEVVALTRRKINHTRVLKKVKKFNFTYMFVIAFINILFFSSMLVFKDYTVMAVDKLFYNQKSQSSFIDDIKGFINAGAEALEFDKDFVPELSLPIISKNFVIEEDGYISFTVDDSILVAASAKGIVTDSGILETGGKFVEIKHSKTISTKYENIEIAGVVRGDIIKQGQDIATCKSGEVVRFTVLLNGQPVQTLKIEDNKVVWQEQN